MTPMTRERFETLAEAYGGEIARWPKSERDAAAGLMAAEPAFAQAALVRAGDLDEALRSWPLAEAAADLRDRIAAAAPDIARPPLSAWLWRAGLGAGLAAACAAGLVVGVGLSPDPPAADAVATAMSSFDGAASVGDL